MQEPMKPLPPRELRDTADILLEYDAYDREDIVEGLIPSQSITLLTGPPKIGKSTMLYKIIDEMNHGGSFAGRAVKRSTCWILSDESVRTLGPLIHRVGPGIPSYHRFLLFGDFAAWSWETTVTQLITQIRQVRAGGYGPDMNFHDLSGSYPKHEEIAPPDVIVVDTLGTWARMQDINAYHHAVQAFSFLKMLRDQTQCAIIVIHHTKKEGGGTVESALGSVGLTGQSDQIMLVSADADDPTKRIITTDGRFDMDGEFGVSFDREAGTFSKAVVRHPTKSRSSEYLTLIEELGECSTSEVAAAAGVSENSARKQINNLLASGAIERVGSSNNTRYRVNSIGDIFPGTGDL